MTKGKSAQQPSKQSAAHQAQRTPNADQSPDIQTDQSSAYNLVSPLTDFQSLPQPIAQRHILQLQRTIGNQAVQRLVQQQTPPRRHIQRMPTRAEMENMAGPPTEDWTFFGKTVRSMGTLYKNVLDALNRYDTAAQENIPRAAPQRTQKADGLQNYLRNIQEAAQNYGNAHRKERKKNETDSRLPFIDNLINQANEEMRIVRAVGNDNKYLNAPGNYQWTVEIKLRQFNKALDYAAQTVQVSSGIDQRIQDVYNKPNLSNEQKKQQTQPLREELVKQDTAKAQHYQDAIDLIISQPQIVSQIPLRRLNEALLEAGRSAGGMQQVEVQNKLFQLQSLDVVKQRILSVKQNQEQIVSAKINQVKQGILQGNAVFSDQEFVQLTAGEEDMSVTCGIIAAGLVQRNLPVPGWAEYAQYQSEYRVKELARYFHKVNPAVQFAQLPPALRGAFTLLRQPNPLADWIKVVMSEGGRLQGQAQTSVETVRQRAAARSDQDYQAALQRLQNELHIPANEVEEVLRKSLLVLVGAPLTVNFSHKKLNLILQSGGFKNYWEVNQPLQPGVTKEEQQKYEYQQTRLRGEEILYGATNDLNTKFANASQGSISTGANIANYKLGTAPSRDYGRSVAWLKNKVKERATYTPWDALDVMKRIQANQGIVGPEVVATSDHMAAIIRYCEPKTLKAIVEKAKNPKMKFENPVESYVEAAIHGPLTIQDIDRITINSDDLEDNGYEEWESQHPNQKHDTVWINNYIDQVKQNIIQGLGQRQIPVDFESF
jgi:hypothetical protein